MVVSQIFQAYNDYVAETGATIKSATIFIHCHERERERYSATWNPQLRSKSKWILEWVKYQLSFMSMKYLAKSTATHCNVKWNKCGKETRT